MTRALSAAASRGVLRAATASAQAGPGGDGRAAKDAADARPDRCKSIAQINTGFRALNSLFTI